MARGYKPGDSRGFVGDVLRLVAAAGLLAAVAIVTVNGVNSAGSSVERNRQQDRVGLAKALAPPLADWLKRAQDASSAIAAGTPAGSVPAWEAMRVDRAGAFTGLSGRYVSLSGVARSHPCPTGAGLKDLVDSARQSATPTVMILNPPWSCEEPLVAAAAPAAGGGVVVVTGDVNSFLAQAAVASHFEEGIRTYVIDPAGATLSPGQPSSALPTHLGPFAAQVASGAPTSARHTRVDGERQQVIDAGAAVGAGWAVVVEQDADKFDIGPVIRPSQSAVLIIGGLFVLVLLLQARSDARRRAEARHADAHTAAFLAVLGHELRTPLTVIKGFVDTLANRWDQLGEEQRHDLVDRLPIQTRRMNRVVDRLVLAANLQAGSSQTPAVEPVDVAPLLERAATDYRPIAPLHEFVVKTDPDVRARADSKALQQILDQLIDNAVKYSPSGGVVRLTAARRKGHVEISVEDEGVGLPSDARDIFDAFAQGEGVDRRVHAEGGVGLGLYIARTLCHELGGSVRAERRASHTSTAATGSRFVVTLRACRARVPSAV